jgi:hypothetical protein
MAEKRTTREIAELLGVETWRVQRLFSDGTLPEWARFAGKRTVPTTMLPQIVDALRDRGCSSPPHVDAIASCAGCCCPPMAGPKPKRGQRDGRR